MLLLVHLMTKWIIIRGISRNFVVGADFRKNEVMGLPPQKLTGFDLFVNCIVVILVKFVDFVIFSFVFLDFFPWYVGRVQLHTLAYIPDHSSLLLWVLYTRIRFNLLQEIRLYVEKIVLINRKWKSLVLILNFMKSKHTPEYPYNALVGCCLCNMYSHFQRCE